MKCHMCGKALRTATTDLPLKVSERTIVIFKDLPVVQCESCPEYLIDDATMTRVDELLAHVDGSAELEIIPFAA